MDDERKRKRSICCWSDCFWGAWRVLCCLTGKNCEPRLIFVALTTREWERWEGSTQRWKTTNFCVCVVMNSNCSIDRHDAAAAATTTQQQHQHSFFGYISFAGTSCNAENTYCFALLVPVTCSVSVWLCRRAVTQESDSLCPEVITLQHQISQVWGLNQTTLSLLTTILQ